MFLSWWRSLVRMADPKARKGTKHLRVPPKFRAALRVEQMEDRLVPTGGTANVFLNLQNSGGALNALAAARSTTVPVYIDFNSINPGTSGGISGGTFYVAYDPSVLSISETPTSVGSDIKLGSLLTGLSANYTLAPAAGFSSGVVAIGLTHQNTAFVTGAPSGHLIELDFHLAPTAALNSSTLLDLQSFYQDNLGNLRQTIIHDSGSAAYGMVPPPSTYGALLVTPPPLTQPGALTPSTFTPADTDTTDAAIQIVAQPPNMAPIARSDTFSMAPNNANFSPTMTALGLSHGVLANDSATTNGPMNALLVGGGVTTTSVGPANVSVSSVSATGFTVTVSTAANNAYQVGEEVTLSGVPSAAYNGTFLISSVLAPDQFTYQSTTANLGPSTGGQVMNAPQTLYTQNTPHGSVTLNSGDGSVAYTPAPGYSGTDNFTYEAVDDVSNTPSGPAQATIYVGGYLFIPQDLNAGGLGSQVVVPVKILNPNPINSGGLDDATIAINYDSAVFTVANVTIGAINAAAGWTAFTANTNNAGEIIITTGATNGASPISSTASGSLALITFNVIGIPPGNTSVINLAGVSPQVTALDVASAGVPVPLPFAVSPADNLNFDGSPGTTDGLVSLTPVVSTSAVVSAAVGGSSVTTVTYGTPVTLTATITPASSGAVPAAGSVDFKDGSIDLGLVSTETPSGNSAVFTLITTVNQLQVTGGFHSITAHYAPGAGFSGSNGTLPGGLAVTTATLTIKATANAKTYDSTTSAAATPTVIGLIGSDSVAGLTEVYSDRNVGSNKTLSISAYSVVDGSGGADYTVVTVSNTAGIITQANLTITATTNSKTYDATKTAGATPTVTGLQGTDSLTASEVYADANAGSSKVLSVGTYAVNDGNSGNNYAVTTATNTNGVITQANLTITATANSKTYDAAKTAAATPTVSGLKGTDSVTASEVYADANVGSSKVLSISAYTVGDGNSGNNYQVTTTTNSSGQITKANLTITAATNAKTYDASKTAAAAPTVTGLKGTDSVAATEVYVDANSGSNKVLSISAYSVNDGNSGNNYTVTTATNATGVITQANLTITATTNSKTYDATKNAAAVPTVTGLKGSDSVAATEVYAEGNVGSGKILSISAYTVSDTNGGNNYTVTTATNTAGIITAAPLTITAVFNSKNFDGTVSAAATPTVAGLLGNDSATNLSEVYADPTVGIAKTLSVSAYTITDGNGGNNYAVATVPVNTGVIMPGTVTTTTTVLTSAASVVYGTPVTFTVTVHASTGISGAPTGTVHILDNSIDLGLATQGSSSGQDTTYTLTTSPKALNVTAPSAVHTITANYFASGVFVGSSNTLAGGQTVTPAPLTITASRNTKTYNSTTSATVTPTVSGLVAGDTVTGLAEVYSDRNAGSSKVLSVSAYTVSDGNGGNNYTVTTVTSTTGVISQANLTITATTNAKTYDSTSTATATPTVLGLQGNDTVGSATLYVIDSSARVVAVDAVTGTQTLVASGGFLNFPSGIALLPNGDLVVTDRGSDALIEINPLNGHQSLLSAGQNLVDPFSVALGTNGMLYVGDTSEKLVAVNPINGQQSLISSGGLFKGVRGLIVLPNGNILVGDRGTQAGSSFQDGSLIIVNPISGGQSVFASGGVLTNPDNLVLAANGDILVGDHDASGGGAVYSVNSISGAQSILTSNGNFGGGPNGIAIDGNGNIYVSNSPPEIVKVNPVTGAQTVLSANGLLVGPYGILEENSALQEVYTDANAGSGKSLIVKSYVVTDGNNGNNYTVTTVNNTTGTITKANLTITATTNAKTYDATKTAAATPTVTGLKGTDSVAATEVYADANAGSSKVLSVSAFTVSDGNSGNNYTVTTGTNTTGVISQANLTITATTNAKTYDATKTAAATPTVTGLKGTDSVAATEVYADANAGSSKILSVSAFTVSDGNSGNNYTVTTATNTTGLITKASLTITATTNAKTYSATTNAAALPTVSGLQGSDTATGLAEVYSDVNVGSNKTLSVSAYTITDGNGGNNYTVGTVTNTTGSITKANLKITAASFTRTYDATTATLAVPTLQGLKGTDSVTGMVEVFDTANAGSNKTLSVSAYTVNDGNGGGNYSVILTPNTTGIITQASLTIKAVTNTKQFDATVTAAAIPTVTGLLGGDSVSGLAEVYDTSTIGTGKTLSVSSFTVVDGNSGNNYTVNKTNDSTGAIVPPAFSKFLVTILSSAPIVAGQNFLFEVQAADANGNPVTNYNGPSSVTINASPADTLGNSFPLSGPILSAGVGFFQGSLVKAGSYTLLAAAGGFSGQSSSFTVVPSYADHFLVVGPSSALTGVPINVTASVFDHFGNPITNYTGAVKLTSSDGAAQLGGHYTFTTSGANPDNGTHTFSAILSTPGNQTVSVSDTLSTNPAVTGTTQNIATRGLLVNNFTQTPTGFTATFNRQITPGDLSMYASNLSTVQDVTMHGTAVGPIHGTVVVDPSNLSITFNATSSYLQLLNKLYDNTVSAVLPDDTYTISLASGLGTNGFVDLVGDHLDGTNTGGHADFVTTFTTSFQQHATPALGVPDFARGPDNSTAIKAPNNTTKGIPLTLYQAANVTDVTFTLAYNPAILNVSGVLQGALSDATDPSSTLTMVAGGSPGLATFHYHDAAPQSGALVLGDLVAVVPNTAVNLYKSKALLQIGNVVINQGAITGAVGATSVDINSYLGDVDGDGLVQGSDKLIADQVAMGKASGFDSYKLTDPVVVGDAANDLTVDAGDVAAINFFELHQNPAQIPTPPTQLLTTDPNYIDPNTLISPNAADPTLSLVTRGLTTLGSPMVSVMIDDPHPAGSTGMTEASLALTYDPAVFNVSAADISLGTIPSGGAGWQLESVADAATGQIGIEIYSLTPITAGQAGSLVNIAFHSEVGASNVALSSVQLVNAVSPGGISFATIVADSQGGLILSPGQNQIVIQTGSVVSPAPQSSGSPYVPTVAAKISDVANVKSAAGEILNNNLAMDNDEPTLPELSNGAVAAEMPTPRTLPVGSIVNGLALPANLNLGGATQLVSQVVQIGVTVAATPNNAVSQPMDRLFMGVSLSSPTQIATDWLSQIQSRLLWNNSRASDWLPLASEPGAAQTTAGNNSQGAASSEAISLLDTLFADFGNEADDGSIFGDL